MHQCNPLLIIFMPFEKGGSKSQYQINSIKADLRIMNRKIENIDKRLLQIIILLKTSLDKFYSTSRSRTRIMETRDLLKYIDQTVRTHLDDIEPGLSNQPIDLIQDLVKKHGGLGKVTEKKTDKSNR